MGWSRRLAVPFVIAVMAAALLVGCGSGGGGQMAAPPSAPDTQPPTSSAEAGPFVIETAATANLQMETIQSASDATFVAINGASLTYVATQEVLDRIVCRHSGISICDMWGGNCTTIPGTDQYDQEPAWSPDGTKVAFSNRSSFADDGDIYIVDTDGSNLTQLTDDAGDDRHPTWSPDGGRIAFESDRSGEWHIYVVDVAGQYEYKLSSGSDNYMNPEYRSDRWTGELVFATDVFGPTEICKASEYDFDNRVRLTDTGSTGSPTWSADGEFIAYQRFNSPTLFDVHEMTSDGTPNRVLAAWNDYDLAPSYSSCGKYVAYQRNLPGYAIYIVERTNPSVHYEVVPGTANSPDFGSPTLQTSRVLIGPDGSDRGFDPPIQPSVAYGAVAAFSDDGYLNFVRIGIAGWQADTLTVSAQGNTGNGLVAMELTAGEINALHQDNGAGKSADFWDLSGDSTSAALLLFNAETGKLSSVLALEDEAYSAAAGDSGPTFREDGGRTIVEGNFSAVYDADGNLVAGGDIHSVEVDPAADTTTVL